MQLWEPVDVSIRGTPFPGLRPEVVPHLLAAFAQRHGGRTHVLEVEGVRLEGVALGAGSYGTVFGGFGGGCCPSAGHCAGLAAPTALANHLPLPLPQPAVPTQTTPIRPPRRPLAAGRPAQRPYEFAIKVMSAEEAAYEMHKLSCRHGAAEAKQRLLPQLFAPMKFASLLNPEGTVVALAFERMAGTFDAPLRR